MKNWLTSAGLITLALLYSTTPLLAHGSHCHVKGSDGKLADYPGAKDEKSCKEKNGVWLHHHSHCHIKGADGKMSDAKEAMDEKTCVAKGGEWKDHGHAPTE